MEKISAAAKVQDNLPELFRAKLPPGDAYISFQLTSEISALLSMRHVQESLILKAKALTSLPSMPIHTLGMVNSQNRVFCVFDLATLLSLASPMGIKRQYQILVLKTSSHPSINIGLAVSSLLGVERIDSRKFSPLKNNLFNHDLTACASSLLEADTAIPVLELEQIIKMLKEKS